MPINYYHLVFILTGLFALLTVLLLPIGRSRAWLWAVAALPWASEVLQLRDTTLTLPTDIFAGFWGILTLGGIAFYAREVRELWQHTPLFRWIGLYFLWMGVTASFSNDVEVSLKFWISQSAYWLAYGVGAIFWLKKKNSPYRLYQDWLLPSAGAVMAICVLEHLLLGGTRETLDNAIRPFMREHTVYGAYTAWFFTASVILASLRPSIYGLAMIFISGAALLLSYSRGGWLSALGALGLFGALEGFRRLPPIGRLIASGVGGGGLLITLLIFFQYNPEILQAQAYHSGGEIGKHFASSFDVKQNESNLERINRWFAALQMIEEQPWVGFGPNTFSQEYSAYQRSLTRTKISVELGEVGGAHSEYLTAASEMGILGFILLMGIYLSTALGGIRRFWTAPSREERGLYALLVFPLLSYYLHGFINNFMDHGHMAALVYLHWGLFIHLSRETVPSHYDQVYRVA
ncbi:MAG: O-antigen ligase family protein [Bacteroidia bacterium]|nr:O-antigen ligase family protein [Bacteroidia bacterium]